MTLRDYLLRADLPGGRAKASLLAWLATQAPDATADAIVAACPRGDWLVWLYRRIGVHRERLAAAVRPAVLRTARTHAPAALDRAVAAGCSWLAPHAVALRALADDASFGAIHRVARGARNDARRAADDSDVDAAWLVDADRAAWVATGASAAATSAEFDDCVWAALTAAECDGRVWEAAAAAEAAAARAAEHALCAADVRREIPWSEVAPLFAAALVEVTP